MGQDFLYSEYGNPSRPLGRTGDRVHPERHLDQREDHRARVSGPAVLVFGTSKLQMSQNKGVN